MRFKTKLFAWAIVISLVLMIGFSTIPQAKANSQFIISSWDHPDEYGQGITLFHFYENSTGSWVEVYDPTGYRPDDTSIIDWNASVAIKLRCHSSLNSTFLGLSDDSEGMNYIRHSVTVSNLTGVVFSQQNFTYHGRGHVGSMYFYQYEVVLNFLPEYGEIYTVTVTYEVFY